MGDYLYKNGIIKVVPSLQKKVPQLSRFIHSYAEEFVVES